MIPRIFLFPRSDYLSGRWWHRLATVLFWAWLAAIAFYIFYATVVRPYSWCIRTKDWSNEPSEINCGSGALDYAFSNLGAELFWNVIGGFISGLVVFYLLALLPSIIYRIVLYVAKGSAWRDRASAA